MVRPELHHSLGETEFCLERALDARHRFLAIDLRRKGRLRRGRLGHRALWLPGHGRCGCDLNALPHRLLAARLLGGDALCLAGGAFLILESVERPADRRRAGEADARLRRALRTNVGEQALADISRHNALPRLLAEAEALQGQRPQARV